MDIKGIIEAVLFSAERPLTLADLQACFPDSSRPDKPQIRAALAAIGEDYRTRAVELTEVASGFRFQVRREYSTWVARLLEEKPPRYSRALLETLAIIAYRQPATRGGIEEIRGVAVSTAIIRTLLDRGWIRIVGYKEVPGRPALYATTREFLDYFNLKNLGDLPPLGDIQTLDPESGTIGTGKQIANAASPTPGIQEIDEIT
ncbi:MAG: SMC-Scp complex subunit ScpB [Gammaproteobacteria bacterium]